MINETNKICGTWKKANDIVKILMKRDGLTKKEAQDQVNYCKQRLQNEAIPSGDYNLIEDIIAEELGLEPDYMVELLL